LSPEHLLQVKSKIKIQTEEAFMDLINHLLNEGMDINVS